MTEPKFTPGPWEISDLRESKNPLELLEICALKGDELVCVGRVDKRVSKNKLDQEDEANARLIAAAPDMYDELKRARDVMQRLNTLNSLAFSLASIKESYISEISALLEQINGEESK